MMINSALFQVLLAVLPSSTNAISDDGACNVMSYFSFSKKRPGPFTGIYTDTTLPPIGYSLLAASELARQQFNARDASVVPEMAELTNNCSVDIPHQRIVDGELSKDVTMKSILSELKVNDSPCAVIGAMETGTNDAFKEVTNAIEVPHILYWQVHQHLLDPRHSQNIISPIPSPRIVADIMLEYLGGHIFRDGMAIIHENPDLSADMAEEFVNYAPQHGMQNYAFKRWSHDTIADLDRIILDIKNYGLKTIFLNILSKEKTVPLAESLNRQGMLEPDAGYLYILPTHYMKLDALDDLYGETELNSVWDKLLSNSMVFDEHMDGFRASESNDRFLAAWRKQNSTMVEQLNAIHPIQEKEHPYFYMPDSGYFQAYPSNRAAFAFDAMMSIGLGACRLQAESSADIIPEQKNSDGTANAGAGGQRVLQPPPRISNNKLHAAIVDLKFTGASGFVSYDAPGQRTKDSSTVGIYNIRPVPSTTKPTTHHSYEAVLTSVYNSGADGWTNEPNTSFIYQDGSTVPPPGEREVQEHNYLSSWVRALGFSFLGITWSLSLACIAGILMYRKINVVRGGQPFFLQLICASSIIMSTSILTLSFDEGSGWSNEQLNIACTLTPWFFIIGQLLLVACLFSKLWRVNKVMQFRRRTVTIRRASYPIVIVLVLALIVLITWSAVDPWIWERVFVQEYPLETYGRCTCDNFWAYFGPLIALVVCVEIMVIIYAWKALDIAEELGDSRVIFFTIFTQLQAWAVGIPILIVTNQTSADGTYLGRVVIIFCFACSPLVILIVPKVCRAFHLQRYPDQNRKSRGSVSAGGATVRTTGLTTPATRRE